MPQWQQCYRQQGSDQAEQLLNALMAEISRADPAWISWVSADQLQAQLACLYQRLAASAGDLTRLPLFGVPFAVKDNIDVQGLPTTAACAEFAYHPERDAVVVARLKAAGAVLIGKTNLDQFATGLVGTRSPYGEVPNTFDPTYVSGGSSSGSASVVARGLVPFALGTDTAGSGRVPAGFNNLVGWKPTRGAFSTQGVLPACRSLDCVSIFSLTVADAAQVAEILTGFDAADIYSRQSPAQPARCDFGAKPRFAMPSEMNWFGDTVQQAAFSAACTALVAQGVEITPIDFTPMYELANLLYEGPWVAERHAEVGAFLAQHRSSMDPSVARIIASAEGQSATAAFQSEYRRRALQQQILKYFDEFDALLVPTAPLHPTRAQVAADPIAVNSWLGTYTNFVNLADCSALALPAGFRRDGLPFGFTLIAPAWQETALAQFGQRWQQACAQPLGACGVPWPASVAEASDSPRHHDSETLPLAVVGAHLSGMPLNAELTQRGAWLLERTRSADHYRLYALAGTVPAKPALVAAETGAAIELEIWALPTGAWGAFLAGVPAPLGLGTVELADGRRVKGFICEPVALQGARDITEFGGWRAYLRSLNANR